MTTLIEGISIPIIVAIAYGIIEVLKSSLGTDSKTKKFYPLIAACIGIVLGIVAYLFAPAIIVADNIITAIFVGLSSGLSATGMNQLVKKIVRNGTANTNPPSNDDISSDDECNDIPDEKNNISTNNDNFVTENTYDSKSDFYCCGYTEENHNTGDCNCGCDDEFYQRCDYDIDSDYDCELIYDGDSEEGEVEPMNDSDKYCD